MNEAVFFGIAIFVLGFAAGVLTALWWNSRSKKEDLPIEKPLGAQIEEPLRQAQPEPVKVEISKAPEKPVPAIMEATPSVPDRKKKIEKITQPVQEPVDMVTAINDILQEMIRKSDTPTQVVSLTPEPPVGVSVWVNGKRYPDLDAVVDPATRGLVRRAVAEWERRAAEKR